MKLGIIMDPIAGINYHKDSSLAMLLAAQSRGWELFYMELGDLTFAADVPRAMARRLKVMADLQCWHEFIDETDIALAELDIILMRKDPPFDMEYIYASYLLEYVAAAGTLIVNNPASLRTVNEKFFIKQFPHCIAPTLISRSAWRIKAFLAEHKQIVLKPLGGMGGASVFRINAGDLNTNVIIETVTAHASRFAMAQKFIPEISAGDKRILLLDGQPLDYALARIPRPGESRGNLAAGGHGEGVALSAHDRWICQQVGPRLKAMGLVFVGLDVIGEYLTEINVTSPTCIRELDALYGLDIGGQLMDLLADKRG